MERKERTKEFLEVIERHKGILYKIARAYAQDHATVEDLLQECILQLWKGFDRYDPKYQYSTWIYRIALNTAISYYRGERRSRNTAAALQATVFEFAEPNANDPLDEKVARLHQFVANLPPFDKALFLLYLDHKKQHEIAEIMGISVSNVSTKIGRIKAKIKTYFLDLKLF